MSSAPTVRNLKIKTGVVKRLGKEVIYYQKEYDQQQARIDKLIAENADIHDINKQKEVLEETNVMIPDSKRRLNVAYKELSDLVELMLKENPDIKDTKEMTDAQTVLKEVQVN
ncbi:tubulin binding cofactor A [Neocallimastix lanati (nom. inval.)]|jgi:tubulin-specific chaperone A|uniref:Tubulin-specific chaperone A n=1 Tax=Neocallimastix californiae TaxID=1754190 RepID=A0A1Y2FCP8_9FUNG|nr:tubulin binding cofactor A [Neocallimastix sp. JGI-2020a]ORY80625.1 tubulin binding cofactor A [Neocallimastix californiae]|eukprot:ORY80625.1 tubulin binding cofactor A [Neocallimastix californiae]